MELGLEVTPVEDSGVLEIKKDKDFDRGEGEIHSPKSGLSKSSSFSEEVPMVDIIGSPDIAPPAVPDNQKRHSLPRSLNSIMKGMKRKSKPVDTVSEMKISGDSIPVRQKGSRQIYLSKVFDRVSHGTNRVWSSINKSFTSAPNENDTDLSEHKAGSSRTLGRLFGKTRVKEIPDDLPPTESRTQTLGRRISSTFKMIKPAKQ